jgi:selenide,water dikinase
VLKDLPLITDPNLIVGMEHAEDAGVYRLRDDLAIIQTVDFFTPIVDDPYTFGRIAVTNALSDVYAMGGRPLTALNIVCFPIRKLGPGILREILRGGLDQMRAAGVLLIGGHSVEDDEPKYGLAVTGVIHPERVLFNRGARPGDRLILTKALGTGIAATALKAGLVDPALLEAAVEAMTTLNRAAAEAMVATEEVHACTDITGFGFLGHALEMAEGSGAGMQIRGAAVPLFAGLRPLVEAGIIPGGLIRNRKFREKQIEIGPDCPDWRVDILFDPQTAGGLLIALPEGRAETLLERLHAAGVAAAAIVGEVVDGPAGVIRID